MRRQWWVMLPWQFHGTVGGTGVHWTRAVGSQCPAAVVEQHWRPFQSPDCWQNRTQSPSPGSCSGRSASVGLFCSTSLPTQTHSITILYRNKTEYFLITISTKCETWNVLIKPVRAFFMSKNWSTNLQLTKKNHFDIHQLIDIQYMHNVQFLNTKSHSTCFFLLTRSIFSINF